MKRYYTVVTTIPTGLTESKIGKAIHDAKADLNLIREDVLSTTWPK